KNFRNRDFKKEPGASPGSFFVIRFSLSVFRYPFFVVRCPLSVVRCPLFGERRTGNEERRRYESIARTCALSATASTGLNRTPLTSDRSTLRGSFDSPVITMILS